MSQRPTIYRAQKTCSGNRSVSGAFSTILLIEKEEASCIFLSKALASRGWAVVTATTVQAAEAARDYLGPERIGLVIADMHLSNKVNAFEGMDLYRRWTATHPTLPFLLMSNDPRCKTFEPVRHSSVGFLYRPFALRHLYEAVETHVSRQPIECLPVLARIEAQPMTPLCLGTVLSSVLHLLASRFRSEGISVVTKMPEDLPRIFGTLGQLEQVFLNVLVNAWHAMPQGGIVTIQACTLATPFVQITVQDTGFGMSLQTLARACEPFYTTKGDQATGLGLAICRQIVDHHRGTLRLASAPGMGTTVAMTLPLADVTG